MAETGRTSWWTSFARRTSSPTRDYDGKTGKCGTFFREFSEKNGLDVLCTKDRNVLGEDLTQFSAIILYTSGDLLLLVTGKISTDLTPNRQTACHNAGIAHF